ncbi:diguanylate cyclase domain-containing protein [Luteimonas changyuni]|uniref:diguanylate cyclase domain-containing protein n=1 Tax=Luteimonas sp. MJ145 TaxID=3129234 RepID=UPI0031BBBAB5
MFHHLRLPRTYWVDRSRLAILIASTAWLSLTLVRGPDELAAVWVGNGILTGWLLSRRTATWPGYLAVALVAELPARILAGDEPPYALAIAILNLMEALAVAWLVRLRVPDVRNPKDWLRLGGIATAATLVACSLTGMMAAAVAHFINGQDFLRAAGSWYAAHVVGMVVLATTTLVALREGRLFLEPGRGWSLAATMGLLVAVGVGVVFTRYPMLFLTYPPLLLVAVRHGFAGVGMGVIALGLVVATATALGYGPLSHPSLGDDSRLALLQLYLAGGCLMTIPVCLAMAERNRLAARLGESERRYRMLADHSHDVIARVGADGALLYVSPSAAEMFGFRPAEMIGDRRDYLHPDDRARQEEAMADVLASGDPRTEIYRIRHKDGHYVWVEGVLRCLPSDGEAESNDIMLTARNISRRVAAEQALAASRLELERLSRVDPLTDIANRRQFDDRLGLALKRQQRHAIPIALLCMDIDHFKQVNDGHGHATGDIVLKAFAQRLCDSVRETDLVARLGGDEFVILIEDASPGAAEAVARKVVAAMAEPVDVGGTRLTVSTSIGVAYARQAADAAGLMASGDAALYEAKKAGRNRYHVARES